VHKVVAPEALSDTLSAIVDAIHRGGPAALGMAKRVLAEGAIVPGDEPAMLRAAGLVADARAGAEAKEGVAAFLGKRPPVWPAA
jgi:methylglutaconyl-CoA hydratase